MRKTLVLLNNKTLTSVGIMVIMIKPLATPLKTSIEFIVLPTIGTIEKISRMYSSGMKALSNIKPR